jgi:hypothetical protein
MEEWLAFATDKAVLLIDAMALLVIVFGTLQAFASGLRAVVSGSPLADERPLGSAMVAGSSSD